jgi:hypothetical protein
VLAPAQFVKRLHPRKVDDGVNTEGIDAQGESELHPTKPPPLHPGVAKLFGFPAFWVES